MVPAREELRAQTSSLGDDLDVMQYVLMFSQPDVKRARAIRERMRAGPRRMPRPSETCLIGFLYAHVHRQLESQEVTALVCLLDKGTLEDFSFRILMCAHYCRLSPAYRDQQLSPS
jgi:hypothetical protein